MSRVCRLTTRCRPMMQTSSCLAAASSGGRPSAAMAASSCRSAATSSTCQGGTIMRPSAEVSLLRPIIVAVLLSVVLAACSDIYYDRRETLTFQAGDAKAANAVAQTIDPWSPASENRNLVYNGERMQRAAERYRTNKTTPLMTTSTSSVLLQPGQAAPATPAQ